MYALSKERDALRHGTDKMSSATELLKEKDDIIKQVLFSGWLAVCVSFAAKRTSHCQVDKCSTAAAVSQPV